MCGRSYEQGGQGYQKPTLARLPADRGQIFERGSGAAAGKIQEQIWVHLTAGYAGQDGLLEALVASLHTRGPRKYRRR